MEWSADIVQAAVGALVAGLLSGAGVAKLQRKSSEPINADAVMMAIEEIGRKLEEVIRQNNQRQLVQNDLVKDVDEIKHDIEKILPDIKHIRDIRRDFELLKPDIAHLKSQVADLESQRPTRPI